MKPDAPELDVLFEVARRGSEPSAADRSRVTARVAQRLALGAGAAAVGLTVSRLGWAGSLKTWAVMAVAVAGAGSGAYLLSSASFDEHPALTTPAVAPPPPAALRVAAPALSDSVAQVERAHALPPTPRRDRAVTAVAAPSVPAPSPPLEPSGLARETAALREANVALRAGAPSRALEQLDQLAKQFPHGMLAEEAMATRISALCELGRVSEARSLGTRFVQRYPRSPVAARVRGSCAVGKED